MGWEQAQEGGDICVLIADSCCCTAETNTTLKSSYPLIKNKIKRDQEKVSFAHFLFNRIELRYWKSSREKKKRKLTWIDRF